jgi:serine/threonine-protein kinase ULK4
MHHSDTAVCPIRDIEKSQEPAVDFSTLPFKPFTSAELSSEVEGAVLQVHLSSLFEALRQRSSDKANLLSYFESIVVNSKVANLFFNSVVVSYLLGILRGSASPLIKSRVCSIFGAMTRHATVIDSTVAKTGLVPTLAEQLRTSSVSLRRKAMCALGEILFYSATQMDEETPEAAWEFPQSIASQVVRCLKPSEDEVVQAYAVKTIENITAQSRSCGPMFGGPEVTQQMVALLGSSHDKLSVSAAVILSHLARLDPSVLPSLIHDITPSTFCSLLAESPDRTQQALVTMLIIALQHSPKVVYTLHDCKSFLPSLVSLLEHSAIIVRGKALLVFLLLFRQNARWMISVSDLRFYSIIDKLQRDSYKYVQCCLHHLVDIMVEIAVLVVRNVQDELSRPSETGKNACSLLPIVFFIVSTQSTRSKVAYSSFVKSLASLVVLFQKLKPEHVEVFFKILEACSMNHKALVMHSEAVVATLLPSLLSQVQCADVRCRFSFWKVFSDISLICIMDDEAFDINSQVKGTSKALADLLLKQLPPILRNLLSDSDPISLCTLKFLSVVVDRCPPIVSILKRTSLIVDLLANFEAGSSKLNSSLISIVKAVVVAEDFTLDNLNDFNLAHKLNSVLRFVETQGQDWCLDLLLDIVFEVLLKISSCLKVQKNTTDLTTLGNYSETVATCAEPLLGNFSFFCSLLRSTPVNSIQTLKEKACHCLALLLQLFSYQFCQHPRQYLTPGRVQDLFSLLKCDKKSLQKRTLEIFEQAFNGPENPILSHAENMGQFRELLKGLSQHEDSSLAATAE